MVRTRAQPQAAGIDLGDIEHWVYGPTANGVEPSVRIFHTAVPPRTPQWEQCRHAHPSGSSAP